MVEVRLVDEDRDRDAEVVAQGRDALEVVTARRRGLHHSHGEARPGERADDRASHARRAVANDEVKPLPFGELAGLLFEQGHEPPGIFLSGIELRVDERAEARVADIPLAALLFGKGDGLGRAERHAHAAALTTQGIDAVDVSVLFHSIKTAVLETDPATAAGIPVDDGFVAGDERLAGVDLRIKQDVHVGRVHVEIADDLVLGQMGKARADGRFARAALAADDDDLTHDRLLRRTSARHRAGIRTAPSIPARLRQ